MDAYQPVLDAWFGDDDVNRGIADERIKLWFGKDEAVDAGLRKAFLPLLEQTVAGRHVDWLVQPRGRLALIILLDQFSRNMFRGQPRAFAQDGMALDLALEGLSRGEDRTLAIVERVFVYLPLEHSEDLDMQRRSVQLFSALANQAPPVLARACAGFLDYALRHQAVIERFGRFPHRNEILGRESTSAEIAFLKEPGSSF